MARLACHTRLGDTATVILWGDAQRVVCIHMFKLVGFAVVDAFNSLIKMPMSLSPACNAYLLTYRSQSCFYNLVKTGPLRPPTSLAMAAPTGARWHTSLG